MEFVTLGEITVKIGSGATPRGGKNVYREAGVSFIRSQNILDWSMKTDGMARISTAAARELDGVAVKVGDVLLNITGDSIARCTTVDPSVLPARVSQHVSILRPSEGIDSRYLMAALINPEMKSRLLAESAGGTRNALTKAQLSALHIGVPPLSTQRAIASVLGALDDKIAVNLTVSHTAVNLVMAHVGLACVIEPTIATVADIAVFLNRRRVPLSSRERQARFGDVPYYGAAGLIDTVDEKLFDEPLALVGEDGSVVTSQGRPVVQYVWGPSWVNNHAHVLKGDAVSTELLTLLLQRSDVRPLVTGAVQPKLSMGKLKSLELVVPKDTERKRLEVLIGETFAMRRSLVQENRILVRLREILLPALMSGRLRVKDAERQVEDAV